MVTSSTHVGEGSHFLLVRSGGYRCAIPVDAAKLVTKAPDMTPLHGSAPRFLGLAQIEGEPVAVVDLHALIDPKGNPGGGHDLTVIVRGPGGAATLGLAVDEAFGVAELTVEQSPADTDPRWVTGWSEVAGRAVAMLDPTELYADSTSAEKGAFDAG